MKHLNKESTPNITNVTRHIQSPNCTEPNLSRNVAKASMIRVQFAKLWRAAAAAAAIST